jgi:hypothetical protein
MKRVNLKGKLMKTRKIIILSLILFSILLSSSTVLSETPVKLNIKIILASGRQGANDSRLKDLISELNSVFRYSSYQLLSETNLKITSNQTKSVSLPENRILKLTSKGTDGNRVTLELEILKDNNQIFQTAIRLRNNSSITIGGPEYQGGNLLFNIFASF